MCLLSNSQEPQAPSQLLKQWSSDLYGWYTLLLLLHEVSSCLPISQPPQAELVTGFQGCLCVRLCCDMYHTVSFIYTWLSLPRRGWNIIGGASQGQEVHSIHFFSLLRSWWWTGRPGVLQFVGSQRVRHNWETELNWKILYGSHDLSVSLATRSPDHWSAETPLPRWWCVYYKAWEISRVFIPLTLIRHGDPQVSKAWLLPLRNS